MESFRPFSLTHAGALAAIAAATWALAVIGRAQRDERRPTRLEKWLAWANLALWAAGNAWWNLPPRVDPTLTLPLQLSSLASLVASAALLTRARIWRALLYFWGLGLSTQALVTPALAAPPSSIWFWAFWLQHGFITAAAVYDLAVYRYRPDWSDYRLACLASAGYLALVLPVNLALGANYGFVGRARPATPSLIDFLGPWPGRVLVIAALAALGMALLVLPWRIGRRRG